MYTSTSDGTSTRSMNQICDENGCRPMTASEQRVFNQDMNKMDYELNHMFD